MKAYWLTLYLVLFCCACGEDLASVHITFAWGPDEPAQAVWLRGRIERVDPQTGQLQQLASLANAVSYEPGVSLAFSDIVNDDNLSAVIEARADSSPDSRVLYYGISDVFSLQPGDQKRIKVAVALVQAPQLADVRVDDAVGPVDCPECYVPVNQVTLSFSAPTVNHLEIANDSTFSLCRHQLSAHPELAEGPRLLEVEDHWVVDGWNLDCGLEETGDGPRSVYARVVDANGYPSATFAWQGVLDTHPPTGGTLLCVDGERLIKLQTTMALGAVKADEMWLEACEGGPEYPGECVTIEGGALPCDTSEESAVPVGEWATFSTLGCVRLSDVSVNLLRAKYRDLAHNETPWVMYEFSSVAELVLPWVSVPGGPFMMGCSPNDESCCDEEFPYHSVTVSSFEMLETEVTESQYEISTGETGACTLDYGSGPDHPVRCVTWTDAQAFCEAAGGRLPTEAEFEYAARAGTTSKYYCGDEPECLEDIAWYGDNSDEMQPVAGLLPNEFGLYDMLGNAEEWTGDWYDDDYYSSGVVKDPTGPSTGSNRTVRGGAQGYYAEAEFCSSTRTVRVSERSNVHHPAAIDEYVGFRCVRVSP